METTLSETIDIMECLNRKGYDTYFKGCGNGHVKVVAEYIELCKEVKNGR